MAGSRPNRLIKFAALSMLSLGLILILATPRLFAAANYIGLITALMASLSAFCGIGLWVRGGAGSRVVAILIGTGAALGQGLSMTIGPPGASALEGKSGTLFWLALTFELLTVLSITVEGLRRNQM